MILGIDTSNYKTSVALVKGREIIRDKRRFLAVKAGERGLRQSEALFQHNKNLPEMFEELRRELEESGADIELAEIDAIAYSSRPRPVEGSYMPCFLAGESHARSMAAVLGVPAFAFSHQEGHIEAAKYGVSGGEIPKSIGAEFLACHFSGGTCEVLKVSPRGRSAYEIGIVGGSKDISFGQVLDRTGVAFGLPFPCGEALDKIALKTAGETVRSDSGEAAIKVSSKAKNEATRSYEALLTPIKVKNAELNLSGFETQIQRRIEEISEFKGESVHSEKGVSTNMAPFEDLIREIFDKMTDAIEMMLRQALAMTGIDTVLISGGVASSEYIRNRLSSRLPRIVFGSPELSSDNAVGIAFLGAAALENSYE